MNLPCSPLILLLLASPALAATHTLNGSGGTTLPGLSWATAANWSPAAVPGAADNAVVAATGLVDVRGSAFGGAAEIQDLAFTGGAAVTLHNNSSSTAMLLSLNGGRGAGVPLIAATGNVSRTIAGPGTHTTPQTLGLQLKASGRVDVAAGTLIISARITEDGTPRQLTKTGAGTLVLSGRNAYKGGTVVSAGVLELNGANAGNGRIDGAVTVASGAELRLTGGDGTGLGYNDGNKVDSLTINGGLVSSPGPCHVRNATVTLTGGELRSNDGVSSPTTGNAFAWGNTLLNTLASGSTSVLAGRINIRPDNQASVVTFNVADGPAATDLLVSAALTQATGDCGFVKSGAGTMKVTGAMQLSGFITVSGGTLDLESATVAAGTKINLVGSTAVLIPPAGATTNITLYLNNQKLAAGTWGAAGSGAQNMLAGLGGTGILTQDASPSRRDIWKTLKHGIFSHYTYAMLGDVNTSANAFNATAYASDVAAAGAQYVVWTAWHGNMFPMFPSQAAARYGYGGRCSTRDTVSDMIDACRARGLRVYLYTHPFQPLTQDMTLHNNYINELYAEVVERYGSRIDGLWIDENQINGDQDSLVDYKRLLKTIRQRNPDLVTTHNGGQIYTTDMGGPEVVNSWNFGWSECMYNLLNPGYGPGVEDMLRTLVLEAAANFEGGGVHWSIDGKPYAGLVETNRVHALGRYLAPILISITNTRPSTAFPPPYRNGRNIGPGDSNWFATESADGTKVFLHVLTAPAGNTLALPASADGKTFSNATLLASLQVGQPAQQHLGAPVTLLATPRGLQLTLTGTNTWSALDTVIQLDVASPGGTGMVNDTSPNVAYTGSSWSSQNRRGLGEFADDAHTATANGDAFTLTFSGTEVSWISSRGADRGGVDLYIDDVFQTNVDLSVGATNRDVVFTRSGLPRGTHALKGVKTGGAMLAVDAFRVIEMVNDSDPDLSGSYPTTVGAGGAGYGPAGSQWQPGYNGANWITPNVAYVPSRSLTDTNPPASDYFTFTFTGTGAQCFLSSAFSWAYFFLTLDGIFQTNLQVTAGSVRTFAVANLPMGTHTIKGITWKATTDPSQPGVNGFTLTRPDMWFYQTNRNLGEYGNDAHYSDVNGPFNYSFTGSGVEVIVSRDENARMTWYGVNGMGTSTGARRQNYLESFQAGGSVFGLPNLVPGTHTVTAQNGGNNSGLNFSYVRLHIDALRIYKGESLSSTPLLWGATGGGGSGTWDVATTANWNDGGQAAKWHDFGGTDYAALFQGAAGTVNLSGGIKVNRLLFHSTGYTLQNNTLTLNGTTPTIATAANVTTTIRSTISGSTGLRKTGPGLLVLEGAGSYTGATTVSDGTLRVTGSLAGGAVNVTGGTLDGTGNIAGAVTVQAGATLSPGVALGTLTISNALTLAPGSRTEVDINAAAGTNDLVRGLTTANYGGTLVVSNLAGIVTNGQRFKLFHSAAAGGNFTNITPAPGPGLAWSFLPASGTLIATPPAMSSAPIPAGSVWRYSDKASDLGTAWRGLAFNDAGWSNGPARLGYGNDGEVTTVASNRQWTTYFRRPFFVPDPANVFALEARLTRDDAAVIYLNGTEIWRDTNLTSGAVTYTTPALVAIGNADETNWLSLNLPASVANHLVPGWNVLAAEVHNQSLSSSDIGFDFELTGAVLVPELPSLSLLLQPSTVNVSWPQEASYFKLHGTTNLAPPVIWLPVTNAAVLTNGEWRVVLPTATNGARFYRLQAP